jgi:hypothetical protein
VLSYVAALPFPLGQFAEPNPRYMSLMRSATVSTAVAGLHEPATVDMDQFLNPFLSMNRR